MGQEFKGLSIISDIMKSPERLRHNNGLKSDNHITSQIINSDTLVLFDLTLSPMLTKCR